MLKNLSLPLQKFDHPHLLLASKHDILYQMVQQMGPTMGESLFKKAQEVSTCVV
jgi:hypothetical protein